jgi:L-2-hydroxyglutarate oxidase LhgO
MQEQIDFLVIGAGIVGISIGNSLLDKFPKARVLIADKESQPGSHASGRNSGVLHAGFYYSPESLKAKFCRDGNLALNEVIARHDIPIRRTGKVVVTKNLDELPRLQKLYERGIANGVKLDLLPATDLNKFEPLAKTCGNFLWSPSTAVSDPQAVIQALARDFISKGGVLKLNTSVQVTDEQEVFLNSQKMKVEQIINAAGVNALYFAQRFGVGKQYSLLPVLGLYKTISDSQLPLQTLVYPVPNPKNPFLGVHFTLTTDHKIKIGPTAIPVIGREQYSLSDGFDLRDLQNSTSAVGALARNSLSNLISLAATEFPKIFTRNLIHNGSKLVPTVVKTASWETKRPGLRAQLVDKSTGEFEQDFVVEKTGKYVHILNAVSPGWTASIPFADWVVEKYIA